MILLQPVTFVAWVPYRPVDYYVFQCPTWVPDDFFHRAANLHFEAWSYPSTDKEHHHD
jgi:hypothetical protein